MEILADRTDWSQTFAEPGGGFEAHEYLEPQRVREADGSWAAVSTSLSVRPGGVVAPKAITTGLTLSDGGRGPLFTLAQGGRSLSMSSPFGSLPAPSLSGSTATYRDVLPGVDLLVTAAPTGVSEILEVKSAAAAANPELAKITFPVSERGLSVSADARGNLTAASGPGKAVFAAPAPQMWDSAGAGPAGGGARGSASRVPAGASGRRW